MLTEFQQELIERVDVMKLDLKEGFGANLNVAIASRVDGSIRKFYWRQTTRNAKRDFNRLVDEDMISYLKENLHECQVKILIEMEEELICINANIKLTSVMLQLIKQNDDDCEALGNISC